MRDPTGALTQKQNYVMNLVRSELVDKRRPFVSMNELFTAINIRRSVFAFQDINEL